MSWALGWDLSMASAGTRTVAMANASSAMPERIGKVMGEDLHLCDRKGGAASPRTWVHRHVPAAGPHRPPHRGGAGWRRTHAWSGAVRRFPNATADRERTAPPRNPAWARHWRIHRAMARVMFRAGLVRDATGGTRRP
jgi:hypothetical protein